VDRTDNSNHVVIHDGTWLVVNSIKIKINLWHDKTRQVNESEPNFNNIAVPISVSKYTIYTKQFGPWLPALRWWLYTMAGVRELIPRFSTTLLTLGTHERVNMILPQLSGVGQSRPPLTVLITFICSLSNRFCIFAIFTSA